MKKEEVLPQACTRTGCMNYRVQGSAFCKEHGGRRQVVPPGGDPS